MESKYLEYPVGRGDRVINRFVKLALIARGSRKLFSSKKNAAEYIEKAGNELHSLEIGGKYPCRVSKKTIGGLECAVFEAFEGESEVRVLFFHGGAYVRRMTKHHIRALASLCAKSKAKIIAPCYPTAPDYTFSQSIDRLAALYGGLCADGKRTVLSGDSCGAAIAVCLQGEIKKRGLSECEKLVLFSPLLSHDIGDAETAKLAFSDPMFGGTEGLQVFVDVWSGENNLADPCNTDFSALVPTYIFTSSGDMLSVGCRRFFEKAVAAHAEIMSESYDGMFHDFFLYPLPCSKKLIKKAAALIQ